MDAARGKSLLESWVITFLPDWQPPLILNLCLIYFKITWALTILLEHMHKKFVINQTKIKGGCQSGRKVVPSDSKSDLPLAEKQEGGRLPSWSWVWTKNHRLPPEKFTLTWKHCTVSSLKTTTKRHFKDGIYLSRSASFWLCALSLAPPARPAACLQRLCLSCCFCVNKLLIEGGWR